MRGTKANVNGRASLRRAAFAILLVSMLQSLILPASFANDSARSGRTSNPATSTSNASALTHEAAVAQAQAAYGKTSLTFEANEGQTDSQVNFLTRAGGATIFLTPTAAVFALAMPSADAGSATTDKLLDKHAQASANAQPPAVLQMQIEGANQQPSVEGLEKQEGIVNYFIGNDPAKWHAGIPTYGRVQYSNIYPGVDMVYYGTGAQLEYDFVVQPGADASQVSLKYVGAQDLQLDAGGNLIIKTAAGDVLQQKPAVYQEADGGRQEIESGYMLKGGGSVGFSLGAYDRSRSLIIDPVLAYSTYLGGSSPDSGNAIAVDSSGNAYVTGQTFSTNFPTANAIQGTFGGGQDAFVTKLNATGSALVYSTYLGGSSPDSGEGIAVDSSGNAYVTGVTQSTNFPTANAIQGTFGGNQDVFVTKLNAIGSALVYSTYLGGSGTDNGEGIAVDSSGNAYVTGFTQSTNFPTANAFQGTSGGGIDAFVTKLSASGSSLVYSTYLGGSGSDTGAGIAVDSSGNAYVAGQAGTNFPVTASAFQKTIGGSADAYVTKLNASGSSLVYSTYVGGSNEEFANAIAIDSAGNAYITGITFSTNFPTANAIQSAKSGSSTNAFVTKLNAGGSALIYSTYLGGTGNVGDDGNSIAVDPAGNAYVTGFTSSTDFPVVNAIQSFYGGGETDAYVAKLNAGGSALLYSTYLGGSGPSGSQQDNGFGIAVDSAGNAYVTGETDSKNFPVTPDAFQPGGGTGGDAFIAKIGSYAIAGRVLDASNNGISGVTVTLSGTDSATTTTDSNGDFSFFNTTGGGNYTVTPSKAGFTFSPSSFDISSLNGNQSIIFIGTSTSPNPTPPFFSTGLPDGRIGTASRPAGSGIEVESADDFILAQPTTINSATFYGLLPTGAPLSSINFAGVEIYRVFPLDSVNPPSGNVPTRVNSPSDNAFASRDSSSGLTFTATLINSNFSVANTVINGINKIPNQTTGGEGPATGQEVLINVTFTTPLSLPADHYFFKPEVGLSTSGNFLWLSSSTPPQFTGDLQAWIRNTNLDPDWLRIGTDIVGGNPAPKFNMAFSLSGQMLTPPPPPTISINDVSVVEGNTGSVNATFTVTLSAASSDTVLVDFFTAAGTATAGTDFTPVNGTLTFTPGETAKTITVPVNGDTLNEPDETFFVNLSNPSNATIAKAQGTGTILNDDAPVMLFSSSSYTAGEGDGHATITVNRMGDTSQPATIDYATSDQSGLNPCSQVTGLASQRCDYAASVGTLRFAAGESSKNISIPLVDDAYAEGNEVFTITLSNPVGGAFQGPVTAPITIVDNDVANGTNPLSQDAFFVRQHYIDFLGREPDPTGFAGWINILSNCPASGVDANGNHCDRIEVSSDFYRSEEFQTRGYFIYRFYRASLGRIPHYSEFIPDMARISGFLSAQDLEAAKVAFIADFMNRAEFKSIYDSTLNDPSGYVHLLEQKAGVTVSNEQALITGLQYGTETRATVLRKIIESNEVTGKFFNEAFVVEAYFGYLRRDPDALFQNWLTMLNQTNDQRTLVNGFVNSQEYRQRFGP